MGEWFTKSFGEDYKLVYRHRDHHHAKQEINSMMGLIKLQPAAKVLDIGCGMGRHSQALRELGYQVTGLDLSEILLSEARQKDKKGDIAWIRGDMRQLPFEENGFDCTVNLFTSFGYFEDYDDNIKVLQEIKRVLIPKGKFIIDYLNPSYILQHLVPSSTRVDKPTGQKIIETREIEKDFVIKKITIHPPVNANNARERQYEERVRLISLEQFEGMLAQAKLVLDGIYGDYDGSPYQADRSKRLILLGSNPE